jgi:hypothetical protein
MYEVMGLRRYLVRRRSWLLTLTRPSSGSAVIWEDNPMRTHHGAHVRNPKHEKAGVLKLHNHASKAIRVRICGFGEA